MFGCWVRLTRLKTGDPPSLGCDLGRRAHELCAKLLERGRHSAAPSAPLSVLAMPAFFSAATASLSCARSASVKAALTLLGQRPDLHDDGLARHPVGCVLQLPGQGSDLHAEATALGSGARVGAAKGVSPDDNGHYLRGRNRPKRWLAA